jgi:hypothetical protein
MIGSSMRRSPWPMRMAAEAAYQNVRCIRAGSAYHNFHSAMGSLALESQRVYQLSRLTGTFRVFRLHEPVGDQPVRIISTLPAPGG